MPGKGQRGELTATDDAEALYLPGHVGGRCAVLGLILREEGGLVSHRARRAGRGCDVLFADGLVWAWCKSPHSSATI